MKRKTIIAAFALMTLASSGCKKEPQIAAVRAGTVRLLNNLKGNLTHIYVQSGIDNNTGQLLYSEVDLTEIEPQGFLVQMDEPIESPSHLYRLHVTGDGPFGACNYDALFGPIPGTNMDASAEIDSTTGNFMLLGGWAWLRGTMPAGQTTRTVAAADGTRCILYIDKSQTPPMDRVILRESLSNHVLFVWPSDHVEDPTYEGRQTVFDTYVENSSTDGRLSTTQPVPADQADVIRRLVTHVTNIAAAWNIE